MQRFFSVLIILIITLSVEKIFTGTNTVLLKELFGDDSINELIVIILGITFGTVYWIKFGCSYSYLESHKQKKTSTFSIYKKIPGRKLFILIMNSLWQKVEHTRLGRYLSPMYSEPVESEQVLGGFFFGKTLITSAIAFYYVDTHILISILIFSAIFDSMTGIYQQTLMNYFHRTIFDNKLLKFSQNLLKRYFIDVFRAQVLTIILMGMSAFSMSEQFHILQNRFVSASYYFNAVIIDKLVDLGAISRNFRSKFVIFASTAGGLLCLLDFAKTDFPSWVSPQLIESIPAWIPGPLLLLAYFNVSVFVLSLLMYVWHIYFKQNYSMPISNYLSASAKRTQFFKVIISLFT